MQALDLESRFLIFFYIYFFYCLAIFCSSSFIDNNFSICLFIIKHYTIFLDNNKNVIFNIDNIKLGKK